MQKIVWSDDFSVGIRSIDEQHKKLIDIINKLIAAPNLSVCSETVSDVLSEMLRYTKEHLEFEEQLLKEHGYPDLEHHISNHLMYLENIGHFALKVMNGNQDVPEELLKYLQDWLINHILHDDMEYSQFLKDKSIN